MVQLKNTADKPQRRHHIIREIGNSLGITIPSQICETLELERNLIVVCKPNYEKHEKGGEVVVIEIYCVESKENALKS